MRPMRAYSIHTDHLTVVRITRRGGDGSVTAAANAEEASIHAKKFLEWLDKEMPDNEASLKLPYSSEPLPDLRSPRASLVLQDGVSAATTGVERCDRPTRICLPTGADA